MIDETKEQEPVGEQHETEVPEDLGDVETITEEGDGAEVEPEQLQREIEETREQLMRVAAEFDNYKKRAEKEKAAARVAAAFQPDAGIVASGAGGSYLSGADAAVRRPARSGPSRPAPWYRARARGWSGWRGCRPRAGGSRRVPGWCSRPRERGSCCGRPRE